MRKCRVIGLSDVITFLSSARGYVAELLSLWLPHWLDTLNPGQFAALLFPCSFKTTYYDVTSYFLLSIICISILACFCSPCLQLVPNSSLKFKVDLYRLPLVHVRFKPHNDLVLHPTYKPFPVILPLTSPSTNFNKLQMSTSARNLSKAERNLY